MYEYLKRGFPNYRDSYLKETGDFFLSLMGEKEIGGSGALPSNGDLHGVRECNVSGTNSDKEASVNGSLEKRTETENEVLMIGCSGCGTLIFTNVLNGLCNKCLV